jgi:GNAT superfamily N-acetyltransferase
MSRKSVEGAPRRLEAADLPALLALSRCAGWNQTAADWMTLLELQPDNCLGMDAGGQVIATATLFAYGKTLAWLGMVLTHPDHRRRGHATRLVGACLEAAAAQGISTVKLDATESGLPLYERFGFVRDQSIERWSGHGIADSAIQTMNCDGAQFALDRSAFGADRSLLLRRLVNNGSARVSEGGFAMMRPGDNAEYLGPCVARSKDIARLLAHDCLATSRTECFWDLLPANVAALELATEFGFQRARRLVRMRRGVDVPGDESMIYAAAGFELG